MCRLSFFLIEPVLGIFLLLLTSFFLAHSDQTVCVCLIFQIIISVQLIKNNLKFLFGYLPIIQSFENQNFNRIQLTVSKSFNLIVFFFCAFDISLRPTNFTQVPMHPQTIATISKGSITGTAKPIPAIITQVEINVVSMPPFCIKE